MFLFCCLFGVDFFFFAGGGILNWTTMSVLLDRFVLWSIPILV